MFTIVNTTKYFTDRLEAENYIYDYYTDQYKTPDGFCKLCEKLVVEVDSTKLKE